MTLCRRFHIIEQFADRHPNLINDHNLNMLVTRDNAQSVKSRAPGRVNLIGEHTDYSGYSVLPCALGSQDVRVTLQRNHNNSYVNKSDVSGDNDGKHLILNLSNANKMLYLPASVEVISRIEELNRFDSKIVISWTDYVICGYYAATSLYDTHHCGTHLVEEETNNSEIDVFVCGNIPAGAGLSSSSALVVASTIAFCKYMGLDIGSIMDLIAKACICAERLVGTMGGGMDQTVSCLAVDGMALHIQCALNIIEKVPLPNAAAIVVCSSLVNAEKASGAKLSFNTRVVECRLAALILTLECGIVDSLSQVCIIKTLKEFENFFSSNSNDVSIDESDLLMKLILKVHELVHIDLYSLEEIVESLKMKGFCIDSNKLPDETTLSAINRLFFQSSKSALEVLSNVHRFDLFNRSLHVFEEAARVWAFRRECENTAGSSLSTLGSLMIQSHESLRYKYDCSCPELDHLVSYCLRYGALGARLTGAGWGGMVVGIVPSDLVEMFIADMIQNYYQEFRGIDVKSVNIDEIIFKSTPGAPAGLL